MEEVNKSYETIMDEADTFEKGCRLDACRLMNHMMLQAIMNDKILDEATGVFIKP